MKVLDVGCGVGGPAREISKFADVHVTGLNINDYQIQRATRAAAISGQSDQLEFVKGDFMVSTTHNVESRRARNTGLTTCVLRSKCPFLTIPSTQSTPSKLLSTLQA